MKNVCVIGVMCMVAFAAHACFAKDDGARAPGYAVTVPVMNEPGLEKFGGREKVMADLRTLGASRVNLCLGRCEIDAARRSAAMKALKENSDWFKQRGLATCAWTWAFHGREGAWPPFAHITDRNGRPTEFFCPLDGGFRAFAAEYAAEIAKSGVGMILYDDDYGFRNMYDGSCIACLCPRHLERYAEELGEKVDAAGFSRRVMSGGRNRWRDAWMKVNGEALLDFARAVRAAVDAVDPEVRIGLCSVMSVWDNDGTDAVAVSRALAGPRTRPFLRLIGAPYWAVNRSFYDCRVQNVVELERMQRSWVGSDVEVVAEGDAYPRPRENCPAAYLELFDMAMMADGRMDGIMKYALDYYHHVDYERGYVLRHVRNAAAYEWIARNMSQRPAVGVRVYEELHKMRDAELPSGWTGKTSFFLQFGSPAGKLIADASIPTVYEGEGVCGVAFGENVKYVPKDALRRGLIVDRRAAELLKARGVSVDERFFVVDFDTKGPKGRGYAVSRKLADAVTKVSGRKLPAYVNGNPDLYLMAKRDASATVVGLWNVFADSVLDGVVELDGPAGDVEFFNCTGKALGDKVVVDEIPPFSFAGLIIRGPVLTARQSL